MRRGVYMEWYHQLFFPVVRLFTVRVWSPVGSTNSDGDLEWGPDTWVLCEACGWGSYGGVDHIEVDTVPSRIHAGQLPILCRWCFDTPRPPFWTTYQNSRHFLNSMRILPESIKDTPSIDLIADFLQNYSRWPSVENDVLAGYVNPPTMALGALTGV